MVRTRTLVLPLFVLVGGVAAVVAWPSLVGDGGSRPTPKSRGDHDAPVVATTPPRLAAHPSNGINPAPPAAVPAEATVRSAYVDDLLRGRPSAWRSKLGWLRAGLAKFPGGPKGALDWFASNSTTAPDDRQEVVNEMLTDHFARNLRTPAEQSDGARSLVAWMLDTTPADALALSRGLLWLSLIPHGPSESDARRLERHVIDADRALLPKSIQLLVQSARAGLATTATVEAMFDVVRGQVDAEIRSDAPYWGDPQTVELLARHGTLLSSDAVDRIEALDGSQFALVSLLRHAYASPPDVPKAVVVLLRTPDDPRALSDADWSRGFVHFVRGAKETAVPHVPELLDHVRGTRDDIAAAFEDGLGGLSMTQLRGRLVAGQVVWSAEAGKLVAR